MSTLRITMTIAGAARAVDTAYGPREERDDVAEFELDVAPDRAFSIFQNALSAALAPDLVLTFPAEISEEQAAALRASWQEKRQ